MEKKNEANGTASEPIARYDELPILRTYKIVFDIRQGMRKVRACARVPEYLLESATGKQAAANHVIRDVTLKLAEGLSDIVTWKMDRDIRTSEIIVNGELWVSEPDVRLIGNWPF